MESTTLSLIAYAKHRSAHGLPGGTRTAVSKAIRSGRLAQSVVMIEGKAKIASADAADAEWSANTRPAGLTPAVKRRLTTDAPERTPEGTPAYSGDMSYAEARRLHEIERLRRSAIERRMVEIELAVQEDRYTDTEQARSAVIDAFSRVRTKLLGVPSRVKQAMPDLPMEAYNLMTDRVREALEELATGK